MGLSARPESVDCRVEALIQRLRKLGSTLPEPWSAQALEAVSKTTRAIPTRWLGIDAALPSGGLGYGRVHEWIGVQELEEAAPPPVVQAVPSVRALSGRQAQSAHQARVTRPGRTQPARRGQQTRPSRRAP